MFFSEKLSSKLANYLFDQGLINKEQISFYNYIYCWAIDFSMFFLNLMLIGLLIHKFIPSIIFCVIVSLLRITSGGSHASSRIKCSVISYLFYFVVIFSYPFLPNDFFSYLKFYIIIPLLIICILSPVDNPRKKLNSSQKKTLKVYTIIVCIFISLILFILNHSNTPEYCNIIILCVMILPIDLIVGYIRNKRGTPNVH